MPVRLLGCRLASIWTSLTAFSRGSFVLMVVLDRYGNWLSGRRDE